MATVTKARPATTGTAKTSTKPLGTKTPTTPVAAKGGAFAKGAPASAAVPRPKMGRFMIGMVAYLVGSYVIQYLIIFLDVRFKWGLEKKTVVTLPLLGAINGITLIFMLSLVGLLFALYKFRILPSTASMRQQQASATTSAKGGTALKSATAAKGTLSRPAATTKARVDAKNTTVGKPTTGKAATATAGANTKGTAKKVADADTDAEPGEHDELYQQVRSQIRAQARKRKR